MIGWGIMLVVIGIGSFVMPAMGIQFRLIQIFGQGNEWMAGIVFLLIGLVLLGIGFASKNKDAS